MAKVEYSALIDHAAPEVWSVLKQFGKINMWHPAILHSVIEGELPDGMVGCTRQLTLADGAILREKLLSVDESNLAFSYRFEESPLQVDNYVATVRLIPLSDQAATLVTWMANFDIREPDPDGQQTATIQALIVGGHQSLRRHLDASH